MGNPVLIKVGAGAADKAVPAFAEVGAKDKILLSPGTADLFETTAFSAYLTVQINFYSTANTGKILVRISFT